VEEMTWWRRLLGLPEPEDTKPIEEPNYIMRINLTHSTYHELRECGWLESGEVDVDVIKESIRITRRPMSRAVREAEGAQPQEDDDI